jgi:hypothetical protein
MRVDPEPQLKSAVGYFCRVAMVSHGISRPLTLKQLLLTGSRSGTAHM